jgi:DNA-binding transcriptional LysR family regulator
VVTAETAAQRSFHAWRALPLAELAMFAAVAEAQGFSPAARRLRTSKATISAAVARLERKLGVKLLQRSTRSVRLTEAGEAALPHVQRALEAARDATEAAVGSSRGPAGLLRVTTPMSFGLLHIAPALAAFARAWPEVKVDVTLDDRVLELVKGGFDLALRIGNLTDSSLVSHRIGPSRNALVAHPDFLRARPPLRAPLDLAGVPALVYSLAPDAHRWTLRRGGRVETVEVRPSLLANSSLALRDAALAGLGVARLPLFVAGPLLADGRLVAVLPEWALPDHVIQVLTPSREHLPPKTRAFIEFLRARVGDPPAWEQGLEGAGVRFSER